MKATFPELAFAKHAAPDTYELFIPVGITEYEQVLPRFIAEYNLPPIVIGQVPYSETGSDAEARIAQLAAALNDMANDLLQQPAVGATVPLAQPTRWWNINLPKPKVRFKTMPLVLPRGHWRPWMSNALGVLAIVAVLVFFFGGVGLLMYYGSSTATGQVNGNGSFSLYPDRKIVVHVDISHQYEVQNLGKAGGIIMSRGCRWNEENDGTAFIDCDHPVAGVVRILKIPQFRTYQKGDNLQGYITTYPATILPLVAGR